MRDRLWNLVLTGGPVSGMGPTGIRDLSWLASAPTPPFRIFTDDPNLHSFPGLERLPSGVKMVGFDATDGKLDWGALARKLEGVEELDSRALGSATCDLRPFAELASMRALILHHHTVSPPDRPLRMVGVHVDSCRVRDTAQLIASLRDVRRLKLEGRGMDLAVQSIDPLPALDWLELRALPKLERLPDVAGSRERLRVLKIWECRRLTDVSSIARMNALRELGIMLCPKLDLATLLSAQNILGMDRVGLHATRKSDHATLAAFVPARITAHFADLEGL